MEQALSTAIVVGSSRVQGNTSSLADEFSQQSSARIFNLNDYRIEPYDYQFGNTGDDFKELIGEVLSFDRIILATPIYWYAPSAQMKNFMDRLSDLLEIDKDSGRRLRGKTAGLISTDVETVPQDCFEQIFRHTFNYLGMTYQGMLYCACEDDIDPEHCSAEVTSYVRNCPA